MIISGVDLESFVDYPGKMCTTLFLSGCNFSCGWCFNPSLVRKQMDKNYKIDYIFDRIKEINSEKEWIKAVTITGGEPTINDDLEKLCRAIKHKRFLVKLDTNGSKPEVLETLIEKKLVDYIAMDLKFIPYRYNEIEPKCNPQDIIDSINLLLRRRGSRVNNYEFRTTLVPGIHNIEVLKEMGSFIKDSKNWYLQNFSSGKEYLDSKYKTVKPFSKEELENFKESLKIYVDRMWIRNL
jgi:pyruvate formate lyase activating enzyme